MKITTSILFLLFTTLIYGQEVMIDVILHPTLENKVHTLASVVDDVIERKQGDCIQLNVVPDLASAKNPYILELWDNKEFVNEYISSGMRPKREIVDGTEVMNRYFVTNLVVKSIYRIYGRLSERKSGAVVEVFKVGDEAIREVEYDEIYEHFSRRSDKRKLLTDYILRTYKEDVDREKATNIQAYKNALYDAIATTIEDHLVPPIRVLSVSEKEDTYTLKYDICPEEYLDRHGKEVYPIIQPFTIQKEQVYRTVGTARYLSNDELEVIQGGASLQAMLDDEGELYISKPEKVRPTLKHSIPKDAHKLELLIRHKGGDKYERALVELTLQSKYLGYRNLRMISNSPMINSLNDRLAANEYLRGNLGRLMPPNHLFADLDNPSRLNKKQFKALFPNTKYVHGTNILTRTEVSLWLDKKIQSYKDALYLSIGHILPRDIYYESGKYPSTIVKELSQTGLSILEVVEEDRARIKTVIVRSNEAIQEGQVYNVYTLKNIGRKTKVRAQLQIETVLNKYVGFARVIEGEKNLNKLVENEKPFYIYLHPHHDESRETRFFNYETIPTYEVEKNLIRL